jgi:hypothetical protein
VVATEKLVSENGMVIERLLCNVRSQEELELLDYIACCKNILMLVALNTHRCDFVLLGNLFHDSSLILC